MVIKASESAGKIAESAKAAYDASNGNFSNGNFDGDSGASPSSVGDNGFDAREEIKKKYQNGEISATQA